MLRPASIRRRLQWLGLFPALSLLLVLLGMLTWLRLQDAELQLQRIGEFTGQYMARASEFGLASGNVTDLQQQASLLMRQDALVYVAIRDSEGHVLHSALREPWTSPEADWEYFSETVYAHPLSLGGEVATVVDAPILGEITIAFGNQPLVQQQEDIIASSLLAAFVAVVIALVIANWAALRLSTPIAQLAALLGQLRSGHYQVRGRASLDGELQSLQDSINRLAEQLQLSEQEQERSTRQLVAAREKAEEANEAKSRFLAMISHELRTPMNGVLGALQLLRNTSLEERQREYVEAALGSTTHLVDIINDILDLSRIEAGKLQLEYRAFSVRQLIDECMGAFRHLAEQKGLFLQATGLDALEGLVVMSDPTRIRQVLQNLLSNAVKFTEEGGVTLQVDCERQGESCLLRMAVTDTGVGIPESQMDTLWESFSQGDNSTSRRYGGAGLGLAIVQRLLDLLHGHIAVRSCEGQGSTFTVELTLKAASSDAVVQPDNKFAAGALRGIRVLLVEDNHINRLVAQHIMEYQGAAVQVAIDGESALAAFAETNPHIILMDIQMPGMDGVEATRRWREAERKAGRTPVPIVALTANVLGGERERYLAAGMNDYLAKPFTHDALVNMIRTHLPAR